MRAWIVVVAAGCAPQAPASPQVAALERGCDTDWWREAEKEPRRAWLVSGAPPAHHRPKPVQHDAPLDHAPLAVLDTQEGDVLLADLRSSVMIARWSPLSALARVVHAEISVSPQPRAAGDESLRILPGFRVADDAGEWIEVGGHPIDGFQIQGYIPGGSTGWFWDEPPASSLRTFVLPAEIVIRHAPTESAPIVAVVDAGTHATARPDGSGWFAITALGAHVIASGYAKAWPRAPTSPELDESDAPPPEPPPSTYGPGTCLFDGPGGSPVGVVRGRLDAAPLPSDVPGWFSLDISTAWGDVRLYTDRAPGRRINSLANDVAI